MERNGKQDLVGNADLKGNLDNMGVWDIAV